MKIPFALKIRRFIQTVQRFDNEVFVAIQKVLNFVSTPYVVAPFDSV